MSSVSNTRRSYGHIRQLPGGRFQASHTIAGSRVSLGTFDSREDAQAALEKARDKKLERRLAGVGVATPTQQEQIQRDTARLVIDWFKSQGVDSPTLIRLAEWEFALRKPNDYS